MKEVEELRAQVSSLEADLKVYHDLAAASQDDQFSLLYIRDMDTAQVGEWRQANRAPIIVLRFMCA